MKERTQQYVDAFCAKDLDAVAAFLADDFVLEDPVVIRVEGKAEALEKIKEIFDGNPGKFDLRARNIYVDGTTSLIEFELELESVTLKGVDVIEWQGDQMKELRAYLDIPK